MSRMIDVDQLIEVVEYQCLNEPTDESTKQCEWFKQVVNAEYERQTNIFMNDKVKKKTNRQSIMCAWNLSDAPVAFYLFSLLKEQIL